ncbi:MAG TPA: thiol reductant ABC exporter subunit CydC [Prosthecochloris aestuarii]|uniref:Thiol reductant ABC exporter subunit CydC n=1 Tax=Prosthecochloris aestuarii TaxID=1102 RepID=A0A831SPQ6_PROAE|nr:thiol reductant ABC exporter subunit CydC [Prosthecochloris aestuarii]
MKILLKLLGIVRFSVWWIALAVIAGFATVGSSIGLLMTAAWLLAKASLQPSFHELQIGIVGVRFFGIARGVLRYTERLVSHNTTFRLLATIRVWFYKALEPLAPARIQHYKSADLLQRIAGDIDTLENLYARIIAPPLVAILVSALMWVLLGSFSWQLFLALFIFQILAAIVIPLASYLLTRKIDRKLPEVTTSRQAAVIDFVQGMAELRLFNKIGNQENILRQLEQQEQRLRKQQELIRHAHEPLTGLCMNGAVVSALMILQPMLQSGALDSIWSGVIIIGIMASFEAFLPIPEAAGHLEADRQAGKRIFDIIDAKPEVTTPQHPAVLPQDHTIRFENVSFTYPESTGPVLRNITFSIPQGKKAAIVGPSGAGKSTIAALLHRFYNPSAGRITIGETDITRMDPDNVRSMIGTVSQRTYLFARTIRENLQLGNPEADDEQLQKALVEAGLASFTTRLDQWAGQHGMQLSGGERQRLALARAILHDAPVLLLDEATASLDTITEKAIMQNMMAVGSSRTLLHITHRLYGMERFDMILVLENGQITQQGTHEELLEKNGSYAAMWNLQNRTSPAQDS